MVDWECYTGKKVQIVVVDSGLDVEQDKMYKNSGIHFFRNDVGSIVCDNDYKDSLGHGTAINSLIHKLAPDAQIYNIKIYDSEFYLIDERLLLEALDYIYEHISCKIVNISSGICQSVNMVEIEKRLHRLYDKGIIIIAAYHNIGCMSLPAYSSYVIGVDSNSAINESNKYIYNRNSLVNLEAKGKFQKIPWLNGKFIVDSGASFAAAHISGLCAKMLEYNNSISSKNVHKYFEEQASIINDYKLKKELNYHTFIIERAVLYPYNKEMHALTKYSDLLSFQLVGVFTNKYMGKMNQVVESNSKHIHIIKNVDEINWDNFDTLILGHVSEMVKILGNDQVEELVVQCIKKNKNIYAFDNTMYTSYIKNGGKIENFFYPSVTFDDVPKGKKGKLYSISKPVLGIFGTDAHQGKFTLQLELRKRFLEEGYNVGQLGTEPNSLLFGFQNIYPMGFNGGVKVESFEAVETINNYMHQIEIEDPDIIIVGGQSGTAPDAYYHLENLNLPQYEFLLGTNPSVVILCISGYHTTEFVNRNINFIESATNAKVLALVIYPMMANMKYTKNLRKFYQMKNEEIMLLKDKYTSYTSLPCYNLASPDELDELYQVIVEYHLEETE